MVSDYDEIVLTRLFGYNGLKSKTPSNAKYTSHDIQNQLVSVATEVVMDRISTEVKPATYFPLIRD